MGSGSETEENENTFDTSHRPKYSLSSFDRKRRRKSADSDEFNSKSRLDKFYDRLGGTSDSTDSDAVSVESDNSNSSQHSYQRPSKSQGSQTPNSASTRENHSSSSSIQSSHDAENSASDDNESFVRSPSFSEINPYIKRRSQNHAPPPADDSKPSKRLSTAEKLFERMESGGNTNTNNSFSYISSFAENSFSDRSPSFGGGNNSLIHELSETEEDIHSESFESAEKNEKERYTTKAPKKSGKRKRKGRATRIAKRSKTDKSSNKSVNESNVSKRSTRQKTLVEDSPVIIENDETDIESDSVKNDIKWTTRGQRTSRPCPASKKPSNETPNKNNTVSRTTRNRPSPASKKAEPKISDSESDERNEYVQSTRNKRSKPCPASKKTEAQRSGTESDEEIEVVQSTRTTRSKPCPASKKPSSRVQEEEQWKSKTRLCHGAKSKTSTVSKKRQSKTSYSEEDETETIKSTYTRSTRSSSSSKKKNTSNELDLYPIPLSKRTFHSKSNNSEDMSITRSTREKFNSYTNSNKASLSKPCPASVKRRAARKPIWEAYNNIDYPNFKIDGMHRKFISGVYVKVRESDYELLHKIGGEQIMVYNWPLKRLYHYFDELDRDFEHEVKYYDDYLRDEYKRLEDAKKPQIKIESSKSPKSPKKQSPKKHVTFARQGGRSMSRSLLTLRTVKTKAELKEVTLPSGLRPVPSRLAKKSVGFRSQKMVSNKNSRASKMLQRSKAIIKKSKLQMARRQRRFKTEPISESESESEDDVYFHECDIFTSINLGDENKTAVLLSSCKEFVISVEQLSIDAFQTYMRKIEDEREEDVKDLMNHILDTIQDMFDEEMFQEMESTSDMPKRKPGPRRRRGRYGSPRK